jgi:hypothetical protein
MGAAVADVSAEDSRSALLTALAAATAMETVSRTCSARAQNGIAFLTDIFAIFIRLVEFKTPSCCNGTKVLSNATDW